jgi:hypothetical protein
MVMGAIVHISTKPPPQPIKWLVYPASGRAGLVCSDVVVRASDRVRACAEGARLLGVGPEDVEAIGLWAGAA